MYDVCSLCLCEVMINGVLKSKIMHSLPLQSISIVFFTKSWRPDSFYDRIRDNRRAGVHTLCLLDIKVCACWHCNWH